MFLPERKRVDDAHVEAPAELVIEVILSVDELELVDINLL
jgi:hypothetical protein